MDSGNKIIRHNSAELESTKRLFFSEGQLSLLKRADGMRSASCAGLSMDGGRWDILLSVLRTLSGHYDENYCVYENPFGLRFDASARRVESRDFPALRGGAGGETEGQRMRRPESELAGLQETRREICRRIKNLADDIAREQSALPQGSDKC